MSILQVLIEEKKSKCEKMVSPGIEPGPSGYKTESLTIGPKCLTIQAPDYKIILNILSINHCKKERVKISNPGIEPEIFERESEPLTTWPKMLSSHVQHEDMKDTIY